MLTWVERHMNGFGFSTVFETEKASEEEVLFSMHRALESSLQHARGTYKLNLGPPQGEFFPAKISLTSHGDGQPLKLRIYSDVGSGQKAENSDE